MALLRFSVFELDQSSGELTRQGARRTTPRSRSRLHDTPSELMRGFVAMPIPATRVAALNALNGHGEEALAWLEQFARNRDAEIVFALRDPAFDAIRLADCFRALDRQIHQR